MNTDATLTVKVRKDTRSIALLDKFESLDENRCKKYTTLILQDAFCIKHAGHCYRVSLHMQRKAKDSTCIPSSLTFSDLKQKLVNCIFSVESKSKIKIVNEVLKVAAETPSLQDEKQAYLSFQSPVEFNAQNSSNRSGYGNRYCGEDLVYEGTLYGETTTYVFVGAQCQWWF